jgi:dihydroorotate dehydrogenase (fumarate)
MDLTTQYLGLTLRNPIVASASPITAEVDNIRRLADLGAGAVVMPSIFEEQIEQERELVENLDEVGANRYAEALAYFPSSERYKIGPERYLDILSRAVKAVDIPVIASLNGTTNEIWVDRG